MGLSRSLTLFLPKKSWVMARTPQAPLTDTATVIHAVSQTPLSAVTARVAFFGGAVHSTPESQELLSKMIAAMGLSEADVVLDPPLNAPLNAVMDLSGFEVIVTLGARATSDLLGSTESFEALRGKFHPKRGSQVMPSFHPSELLARPELKKEAWADLKQVMKRLGGKA